MQARLVPLAHGQVVVENLDLVALHQRRLEFAPEGAREACARHHDHDRNPAPQRVPAHRHEHLGGVVPGQDRARIPGDLLGGREEEFLLRQRPEDRDDLLVVVLPLGRARLFEHLRKLLPQDRNVLRGLRVRLRREEPQEAVFARHRPVGPQFLDADIVHPRPTVHGRFGVGFADDQERPGQRSLAHLVGQLAHGHGTGECRRFLFLQDPQSRPRVDHHGVLAAGLVRAECVGPVAQENEATVAQPPQERLDLAELVAAFPHIAHAEAQFVDHVGDLVHHEAEVVGGLDHVLQTAGRLRAQRLAHLLVGDPGHLHVHDRFGADRIARRVQRRDRSIAVAFHGHERVHEVRDLQVLRREELADRVHDEGSLGYVGLDDRDRRMPARVLVFRIHNLHVDPIGAAPAQEVQRVDAHPRQVVMTPFLEHLDRRLAQEEGHVRFEEPVAVVVDLVLEQCEHGVDRTRVDR